ncbi:ribonuclease HI [Candidatus Saccharibacteria bacterium]|nr:ribonuclease HI [Candidatus Saccharibacteria bacterium]
MLVLWTDGSASPNPGPGGFAVLSEDGTPIVLGSDKNTTNIKMEASAIISAMKYADGKPCEIHTDSEFWINVLTKWAPGWEQNGWRKKSGEIKNLDLVKEAYSLFKAGNVNLVFVRGHVGTELNELADEWANKARKGIRV